MVADIGHCYAILYIYICLLFINQVPVCDDDHPSLQHTARQSLRRDPVWGQEPHCEHPGKFAVLWRWRSATSGAPWLRGVQMQCMTFTEENMYSIDGRID
jgi:hypothetical protein